MSTPKSKAKSANPVPASPNGRGTGRVDGRTSQQKEFSALVASIEKRFGVKVASASIPAKNPYAMSAEQAEKIAFQAGIITRAGNLTRKFK